jgi:hypothetical protein
MANYRSFARSYEAPRNHYSDSIADNANSKYNNHYPEPKPSNFIDHSMPYTRTNALTHRKTVDFSEKRSQYPQKSQSRFEDYKTHIDRDTYGNDFHRDAYNPYSMNSRNVSPTPSQSSTVQMMASIIGSPRSNLFKPDEISTRYSDSHDLNMNVRSGSRNDWHENKYSNFYRDIGNDDYEFDYQPPSRPMTTVPQDRYHGRNTASAYGTRPVPYWKSASFQSLQEAEKIVSPTKVLPNALREHSKILSLLHSSPPSRNTNKHQINNKLEITRSGLSNGESLNVQKERKGSPVENSFANLQISAKIKLLKDTTLEMQAILNKSGPYPMDTLREKIRLQLQLIDKLG